MTEERYRLYVQEFAAAEEAYAKAVKSDVVPDDFDEISNRLSRARENKRRAFDEYRRDVISSKTDEQKRIWLAYWEEGYRHCVREFGGNHTIADSLSETTWLWVRDYRMALGLELPADDDWIEQVGGKRVYVGDDEWLSIRQDGSIYNSHGNLAKPSFGHTTRYTYIENASTWRVKTFKNKHTVSVAWVLAKAYFDACREPVRIEISGDPKAYPTKETIKPIYGGDPYHTQKEVDEQNAFYKKLGKKRSQNRESIVEPLPYDMDL